MTTAHFMHDADISAPDEMVPMSEVQALQFQWMSRLSAMSGLSTLIVDSELDIVHYDTSLVEMTELPLDHDMTGQPLLDVIAIMAKRGDFGPGTPDIFCNLLKTEIMRAVEDSEYQPRAMDILTPSGRRLQFKQDLKMDGYYMLTCRDISESYIEKHALKVALESSHSGYVLYDIETAKFSLHSGAAQRTFGEKITRQFLTSGLKDIIHPDDLPKINGAWEQGLRNRQGWTETFRMIDQNAETIWVKTQATPQVSESGVVTSYIFFYTEVTAQLRIQDDLRQAMERAQKSLSAKNAFLGRLSHEIRTPMNAVVGIADALIHHNGDPEILPNLELIQSSAEKIIRIVDESLEHTKLAEAKIEIDPQDASPADSVRSVCALWEQKAVNNGIDLRCRIDASVPDTILFDSFRYEQCLNNLVSNAVKFSPAGRIDVVLTTLTKHGQEKLVVVVKDTGIGMNDAQMSRLFEAYTQADKSISGRFGGTGLGMNITKQLIELMGGTISVKSTLGKGTLFALTLPIQDMQVEADPRASTSAQLIDDMLESATPPTSDYANLNILVVDDNATNHMVVSSLLGSVVGNIDVAENGVQAIQALEKTLYDVVLMDIHMPVMDGIEATLAIRGSVTNYSSVPIVALTADPQYQQKRLCKNIGMDDALAKPVKLTEVLGALDRVLAPSATSELAA